MMPSVSPFEGGVCCINSKSIGIIDSSSSPSVTTSTGGVGSCWPTDDDVVGIGPGQEAEDSTAAYFSMFDDQLTYSVSVVQQHGINPMMTMSNGGGLLLQPQQAGGATSTIIDASVMPQQQPATATTDFMAQQLQPTAAYHLHHHLHHLHHHNATATKTIPVFLESNGGCNGGQDGMVTSCEGGRENGPEVNGEVNSNGCWAQKAPAEWTESEVTDWLFMTAKEGNVPEEVIVSNSYPSVGGGAQLTAMSLADFKKKYGAQHGGHFYRALQQTLRAYHQRMTSSTQQPHGDMIQPDQHHQHQSGLVGLHNSTGMHHQYHLQTGNNNGDNSDCWSSIPPSMETGNNNSYHSMNNNNNIILPDQQHQHEMSAAYDRNHHSIDYHHHYQQQQVGIGYNQHHSMANHNNNNNNNNLTNKCHNDPLQMSHYQHQDGGNYYIPMDTIIGDEYFDKNDCNYSNGTPSDPDEITMPGSETGCGVGSHPTGRTGKRVGRPSGTKSVNPNRRRKPDRGYGKLWEFIRDLLHNKLYCPTMIRWENVEEGVFRIVQSEKLAALWGELKHNPRMTYEKLSRAMRYYYKSKVFLPVLGRRLVYKFGPQAIGWKPDNPNFERMDHHHMT